MAKDENDIRLWQHVKKSVKPLKASKKIAPKITQPPPTPVRPREQIEPIKRQTKPLEDLLYTSKRRLKRPTIDVTIDLHGMRQAQAKEALFKFIEVSSQKGLKTLLVVTGKGLKALLSEGTPGAIKQNFPTWLSDPQVNSLIHFYAPAHPKDGGSGAYYVVLKKGSRL